MLPRSTIFRLFVLAAFGASVVLSACRSPENEMSAAASGGGDLAGDTLQRIDIHAHYSHDRPFFADFMSDWNMRAMSIYVIGRPNDDRSTWEAMTTLHEQYPEQLFLCTAFDPYQIDDPDFAESAIAQLKRDIEEGAQMVKVWKVIGMELKDESGAYVQIDDPRFKPIWDFLAEEDVPIVAHIAEPRIAWRPLDPEEPHAGYFESHPEYHAYKHPEIPRWKEIMAARDRWLEDNPDLTVIGAHLGSMSHDVDAIARRLEEYPNFYVDTAARFVDLAHQPSDSVRAFFIDYQDRILYGTDMGLHGPADSLSAEEIQNERSSLEKILSVHREYLSTGDSLYFDSPMGSPHTDTKGLNLPTDVLRKIYYKNAARLIDRSSGTSM